MITDTRTITAGGQSPVYTTTYTYDADDQRVARRDISGTMPTDHTFTGQRAEGSLMDYGARYYSPILGRLTSTRRIAC